jgi:Ku70/Ku80 beta-barrel domain
MAPRANWKGYLRLSLVSCPIALYPASSLSEKVSFNRINRKTGHRLKQQNVDSETGEVVAREDTARRRFLSGMRMIASSPSVCMETICIRMTRRDRPGRNSRDAVAPRGLGIAGIAADSRARSDLVWDSES